MTVRSTSPHLTWTTAALALACTGVIEEPAVKGAEGNAPGDDQRPIDDALQARDRELYARAVHYFPGQALTPSRQRLFRLTRTQLDLTRQALLPAHANVSALGSLPSDPLERNYEYAENLGFNPANFTPYTLWVAHSVDAVRVAPESVVDCSVGDAPCLTSAAKDFVRRAFRGVTSDAQLSRYADFFLASAAELGLAAAVADLVDLTLTAPGFVFRDEVQTGADGVLLPAQQLQSISYTLADAPPEALGLAVPTGPLSAADTTAVVERALATPLARAKLVRFFKAWLEIREPDEFEIATSVFPEFTPAVAAAVAGEAQAFLERQLSSAAPELRSVTGSLQSFVSPELAFLYGLAEPAREQPMELDRSQRLGIFTLPAVIASHSGPTTTRLVKRGVFFTRKVMCLPLGVPPEGLDTSLPGELAGTERQKVESVTKPASCAGCHAYINPFGFMQENYDAIGRYRTHDDGEPIDASISVDFLDEGTLTTSSPIEALRGFTGSLRFKQCFTRQLFRFYMGRDEEPGDDPLLRQMFFDLAHGDRQDILGLLRVLAGSPTFSRRSEAR